MIDILHVQMLQVSHRLGFSDVAFKACVDYIKNEFRDSPGDAFPSPLLHEDEEVNEEEENMMSKQQIYLRNQLIQSTNCSSKNALSNDDDNNDDYKNDNDDNDNQVIYPRQVVHQYLLMKKPRSTKYS